MYRVDERKIATLLTQLLNDNKMTAQDLANQLEVSKVAVGKWLKGDDNAPSLSNLIKIADYFHITVEEIVQGKLNNEGNIDYLKRNFDLSPFDLNDLIKHRKISKLMEYYRRCLSIKYRYIGLLPRWANNELSDGEKEEYKYISKYVHIDTRLFGSSYHYDFESIVVNKKEDENLKECIRNYYKAIDIYKDGSDEKMWEIDKLVEFSFDLRSKEVIELGNGDLLQEVVMLLNQQHKDELLAVNIEGKTKADLYGNELIGILLICGAHCIYRAHSLPNIWDDELIALVEGDLVEDTEKNAAWVYLNRPGFDFDGSPHIYDYVDEWKTYSYKEYMISVNKKRTNYLDDLCNRRKYYPKACYEELLAGKYDDYL